MTLIMFTNVIARYVFTANIQWALESTVFLFARLVLLGAACCVMITAHLGVDVMVNAFTPTGRKVLALTALSCCLASAILLFVGCWNYWAPFTNLPKFEDTWRDQIWYEVKDVPMLGFLAEWGKSINQGVACKKMPRFILSVGALLLLLRLLLLDPGKRCRDALQRVRRARDIAARIKDMPAQPFAGGAEFWESLRDAFWGLSLIIIMVGTYVIPGLSTAIFTPTEVAAVYPILVTDFVYKDVGPLRADPLASEGEAYPRAQRQRSDALFAAWMHPDTKATLLEGGKLTVMPMFITANALMLKHVLTDEQFMEP